MRKKKIKKLKKAPALELVPYKKLTKLVRRVDRVINTFQPDVVCVVALDPANRRVMVKPEKWLEDSPSYDQFIVELDGLAHKFCLRLRADAGLDMTIKCEHPAYYKRTLNVATGALTHRKTKMEWHAFCNKCGKDLGICERPAEALAKQIRMKQEAEDRIKQEKPDKSGPHAPRTVRIHRKSALDTKLSKWYEGDRQ